MSESHPFAKNAKGLGPGHFPHTFLIPFRRQPVIGLLRDVDVLAGRDCSGGDVEAIDLDVEAATGKVDGIDEGAIGTEGAEWVGDVVGRIGDGLGVQVSLLDLFHSRSDVHENIFAGRMNSYASTITAGFQHGSRALQQGGVGIGHEGIDIDATYALLPIVSDDEVEHEVLDKGNRLAASVKKGPGKNLRIRSESAGLGVEGALIVSGAGAFMGDAVYSVIHCCSGRIEAVEEHAATIGIEVGENVLSFDQRLTNLAGVEIDQVSPEDIESVVRTIRGVIGHVEKVSGGIALEAAEAVDAELLHRRKLRNAGGVGRIDEELRRTLITVGSDEIEEVAVRRRIDPAVKGCLHRERARQSWLQGERVDVVGA